MYNYSLGKLAATVGTVLNDKLYIVGGYDWHLAEYSDAVYLLQKKERIGASKSNNNNSKNAINSNKPKITSKTEFKWALQECRLLRGRSSHACISFCGQMWIAGNEYNLIFAYISILMYLLNSTLTMCISR